MKVDLILIFQGLILALEESTYREGKRGVCLCLTVHNQGYPFVETDGAQDHAPDDQGQGSKAELAIIHGW